MLIFGGIFGVAVCVAASVVDVRELRIPNTLVIFGAIAMFSILCVASISGQGWSHLVAGLAGGFAFFAAYLLLAIIRPGAMGMGDVKLAAILGMALGPFGVEASVVGFYSAFVVGAMLGLARILFKRGSLKDRIPFAPFIAIGGLSGLLWALFYAA